MHDRTAPPVYHMHQQTIPALADELMEATVAAAAVVVVFVAAVVAAAVAAAVVVAAVVAAAVAPVAPAGVASAAGLVAAVAAVAPAGIASVAGLVVLLAPAGVASAAGLVAPFASPGILAAFLAAPLNPLNHPAYALYEQYLAQTVEAVAQVFHIQVVGTAKVVEEEGLIVCVAGASVGSNGTCCCCASVGSNGACCCSASVGSNGACCCCASVGGTTSVLILHQPLTLNHYMYLPLPHLLQEWKQRDLMNCPHLRMVPCHLRTITACLHLQYHH